MHPHASPSPSRNMARTYHIIDKVAIDRVWFTMLQSYVANKRFFWFTSLGKPKTTGEGRMSERYSDDAARIQSILTNRDALWLRGETNDMRVPHAALTNGRCSDGYVNMSKVLCNPAICTIFATDLIHRLQQESVRMPSHRTWAIGSDHAAATLSFEVARQLRTYHDFCEKGSDGTQLWRRHNISPYDVVLRVEDLITTFGTVRAVTEGIRAHHDYPIDFLPVVATVVNRSGQSEFDGVKIISLLDLTIQTWEQDSCPLCAAGSKRLRPKDHWGELTQSV